LELDEKLLLLNIQAASLLSLKIKDAAAEAYARSAVALVDGLPETICKLMLMLHSAETLLRLGLSVLMLPKLCWYCL
jgi:hypothetical protein